MKPQTLYRGSDNRKEKLTKPEKVWNAGQKAKIRMETRKKEAAAA